MINNFCCERKDGVIVNEELLFYNYYWINSYTHEPKNVKMNIKL